MDNFQGLRVYNKASHVYGTLLKITSESVYITLDTGVTKVYTVQSFKRWWAYVDINKETKKYKDTAYNKDGTFKGDEIFKAFLNIIKSFKNEDILVKYFTENSMMVYYENYAILDVRICKKWLVVYAHPEALTPDNYSRAIKIYPKEWNRVLRAKFKFVSPDQSPAMKSLIVDSIYYRKNI